MREVNKKGTALFIGIVAVLILIVVMPVVIQRRGSERDKDKGIFRILVSSENEDAAAILRTLPGSKSWTWSLTRHRPWT